MSYVEAKIFLEGNGLILENKMKHPKQRWAGVPIILTSNTLPSIMHEPTFYYQNETLNVKRQIVRFYLCYLIRGSSGLGLIGY